MKCNKCNDDISLIDKKDPETQMWSNYWYCDTCAKRVEPTMHGGFIALDSCIDTEFAQKLVDAWYKQFEGLKEFKLNITKEELD